MFVAMTTVMMGRSGEEVKSSPAGPPKPYRNRKANSCDTGTHIVSMSWGLRAFTVYCTGMLSSTVQCTVPRVPHVAPLPVCLPPNSPVGMEQDIRCDLERSSDRKPPVKKPRLPPKRNKSLDFPGTVCECVFFLALSFKSWVTLFLVWLCSCCILSVIYSYDLFRIYRFIKKFDWTSTAAVVVLKG